MHPEKSWHLHQAMEKVQEGDEEEDEGEDQ